MHDKNIAHRDLKPENIIFEETDDLDKIQIKLIDFGLSKIIGFNKNTMNSKLGTPYYVSPEVLEGKYDKWCDLWAIGVITYILLSGTPPFNGKNEIEIFNKIKCCDYDFEEKIWYKMTRESKDFIRKLLHPDPNKRLSIDQALAHPWISSVFEEPVICYDVL